MARCLNLKKVDSQTKATMFKNQTKKRNEYYQDLIELYLQGYSIRKISKLGIIPVGRATMGRWIRNFVSEHGEEMPRGIMQMKEESKKIKELETRISELEDQLKRAELRGRLNERIIEIAEERYHIQIRKKPGAKQ